VWMLRRVAEVSNRLAPVARAILAHNDWEEPGPAPGPAAWPAYSEDEEDEDAASAPESGGES
jgi:hypothetical protein